MKNDMMKFHHTVLLLIIGISSVFAKSKENPRKKYAKEGYRLVWQDEFNKRGRPDASKWVFERGFVRNNELQWYQEENAWCENGVLIIEARRENKPNPLFAEGEKDWRRSRKDIEYTSSCIKTLGKHSWQYGRFEMRAKINIDDGLWPAWWTLGVAGQWPSNGEIDIMEYYKNKLLANIAVATDKQFQAHWFSEITDIDLLGGKKWAADFHTWRMDWNEKEIALYVDDRLLINVAMSELYNRDSQKNNPFKQAHYMLLNLAIGGNNGGSPEKTTFPSRYEIDYVRVYQKAE